MRDKVTCLCLSCRYWRLSREHSQRVRETHATLSRIHRWRCLQCNPSTDDGAPEESQGPTVGSSSVAGHCSYAL